MIYLRTRLKVADNTGAKVVSCIGVIGRKNKKYADVGDIITANVKETIGNSPIKKGTVVKAVVVTPGFPLKEKTALVLNLTTMPVLLLTKTEIPKARVSLDLWQGK